MSSRRLIDLDSRFRERFVNWLHDCEAAGLDLLVTCTLRTHDEQDALYAQGRTKPGRIVTNARAGQSAHNYGLALDFVPIVNGKLEWDDGAPQWHDAGKRAKEFGLEWAGDWPKFREFPHVQVSDWRRYL